MKRKSTAMRENGNVTVLALLVVAILVATAAHVFKNVFTRYVTTTQTAAWREARFAAEAGLDLAIDALNAAKPDPVAVLASGSGVWINAAYGAAGVHWAGLTTTGQTVPITGSANILAFSNGTLSIPSSGGSNGVTVTPPLLLDNVKLSGTGSSFATTLPTQVDVQIRAIYPNAADPTNQWFLIRSMGTSGCGTPSRLPIEGLDSTLRRITLFSGSDRPAITGSAAWGAAITMPPPYATRIVEALVRQVYVKVNAITTINSMTLGSSAPWLVDSYDSSNPVKSDSTKDGYYPGAGSSKIANEMGANIATTGSGAGIAANGKTVMGNASTNQGTVSGTTGIRGTVSADYTQTLVAKTRPAVTAYTLHTSGAYIAYSTSPANPTYYRITKDESPVFTASGTTGNYYVTMIMDTDWSGGAKVPANVFVTIYIQGNINVKGNTGTNTGSGNSNLASHLLIYGEAPPAGTTRTFSMNGNPGIAAYFYGPDYAISLSGNVDWFGALVGKSYTIGGGGNGGMHFDEALAKIGGVDRFDIASYVEDVRQ